VKIQETIVFWEADSLTKPKESRKKQELWQCVIIDERVITLFNCLSIFKYLLYVSAAMTAQEKYTDWSTKRGCIL